MGKYCQKWQVFREVRAFHNQKLSKWQQPDVSPLLLSPFPDSELHVGEA